jgi:hypothetical protein
MFTAFLWFPWMLGESKMSVVARMVVWLLVALMTLGVARRCLAAIEYLSYVAAGNYPSEHHSIWIWLYLGELIVAVIGVIGMWASFAKRKLVLGWLFFALLWVFPIVIEARRCDVESTFCRLFQW